MSPTNKLREKKNNKIPNIKRHYIRFSLWILQGECRYINVCDEKTKHTHIEIHLKFTEITKIYLHKMGDNVKHNLRKPRQNILCERKQIGNNQKCNYAKNVRSISTFRERLFLFFFVAHLRRSGSNTCKFLAMGRTRWWRGHAYESLLRICHTLKWSCSVLRMDYQCMCVHMIWFFGFFFGLCKRKAPEKKNKTLNILVDYFISRVLLRSKCS